MKILLIALTALMLTGCFNTAPIKIHSKPIDRIPLVLPKPDVYYQREMKWIIITPKNADAVFAELKKTGRPIAIIGVTGDGYKILALNNGDKAKFIKQLLAKLAAYETYYVQVEIRDEKHNKEADKDAKKEAKKEDTKPTK